MTAEALRNRSVPLTAALLVAAVLASACSEEAPAVPEPVIEQNILGTAYLGQQNWAEAQAAFRRALELRPGDPLLLTNLGVALIQLGEIGGATEVLREALARDPSFPHAHYNLGLLDNQNGEFALAAEHFKVVAQADPDELFTQYYLGTTLSRIGREDEAVAAYRKALDRHPTHVSSLYGLGRLLMQRGQADEGRALIQLSQEVRSRSGLDEAVGGQYGEQGPYAMGIDYAGDILAAAAPVPVRYENATAGGVAQGRPRVWAVAPARMDDPPRLLLSQGTSVVALVPGRAGESIAESGSISALAAGDVDDDGTIELVALLGEGTLSPALIAQDPGGASRLVDGAFSGEVTSGGVDRADLTLVDRDHDGDLDAFWCWTGSTPGCGVATNDGAGRFEIRDASAHGVACAVAPSGPVHVAFSDVDNDRDIDLIVGSAGGVWLYSNERDGSFEDVSEQAGLGAALPARGLEIADLNKDGWMDLLLASDSGPGLALNRRGRFEPPIALATGADRPAGGPAAIVVDYDNDGLLDLAVEAEGRVGFVRNLGRGQWSAEPELAATVAPGARVEPRAAFDADGDGDLDLAAEAEGRFFLLRNEGGNANRWIALASRGVGDNKLGVGAKVEVLAGALRQKFEVTGPLPVHAGLGSRTVVQSARYLWPSGVLQDEVQLATNRTAPIEQLDRKGTSCPLLYVWRDGGWRFVTDFLGGSAIGYQLAPGVYSVPDTDEYVKIEDGLDVDARGRVRVRLNNQLEEVIWFDAVELLAVDHPAGTELYANESLMPGPPWPGFALFASTDVRPVAAARGLESGVDLTRTLAEVDRDYADDFARLTPKGYAEPHTLELDLGELPADQRIVLLLDGWIDYADSSANVAAAHAGLALDPPSLLVADGRGGWISPSARMGFPAGLPKPMALELTGAFPSMDHRLRVRTNLRIYWDRARVMVGGESTPLRVHRLAAARASLGYGGFPLAVSADGSAPFGYDPARVEQRSPWKAHAGVYTAFGPVTPLLRTIDDRFVTTRNGDEIEIEFDAPAPAQPGWQRSWLLFADGFGKDMDPNSAASDRVEPVPFHGMPRYPYGEELARPEGSGASGGRLVLPSERGWHGAVPQALTESRALYDFELVIRGGTVIDGSGAPARRTDIGITNGRIAEIGDLREARAARTIDASHRVVAPGFIDLHSHADLIVLGERHVQERLLAAKLAQGVTTVIVGNCGLGPAPATPEAAEILAAVNGWMTPDGVAAGPGSLEHYLSRLEEQGLALNAGTLIPHGSVRTSSMGSRAGRPDASELEAMKLAVEQGLREGAFGVSAGLIYPPGMYSDTDELVALAEVVAVHDGLFTCHVRGSSETLLEATRELIEIARRSGARVHHSHLEAVGERFWPQIARVLALEDAGRADGLAITHDVFPYTRAATMMSALFPPWALEGGMEGLLERLADPVERDRLGREIAERVPSWPPWEEGGWPHNLVEAVGWDGIRVASVGPGGPAAIVGRDVADLAGAASREPFDLVADLMLAEGGRVGQLVDEISGRDEDLTALWPILAHPAAAVISDAEDYGRGAPHPAHAGAFARSLRLNRERNLVPLEQLVRKMTGHPAALVGLEDRGLVRPGAWADLVVFDPDTVSDGATWDEPRGTARGVEWVLVNGSVVVESGRYRGGLPGAVLRSH